LLTEHAMELCQKVVTILLDKKAQDICQVDVSAMTVIADAFIVCSGRTPIQVRALADELADKLDGEGIAVLRREGLEGARWIVLDLGAVLVHVFHRTDREFYNLERLWNTGTNITHYGD
jgi:ribosome-associated protein